MRIYENLKDMDTQIFLTKVDQNNVPKMKYLTFLVHIYEKIQIKFSVTPYQFSVQEMYFYGYSFTIK